MASNLLISNVNLGASSVNIQDALNSGTTVTAPVSIFTNRMKQPVVAASTANVDISTLDAGDVLDGITLSNDDRVLLKNQTTGSQNGIYVVATGEGNTARASDMPTAATITQVEGSTILVLGGTVNAGKTFILTDAAGIVGTGALTFAEPSATATSIEAHNIDPGTAAVSITTSTGNVTIDSATSGTVAVGTSAATTLSLGNSSATTTVTGALTATTGTSALNLGTDNSSGAVNIATTGTRTVTVGSSAATVALTGGITATTGTSALNLGTDNSSGAVNIATSGTRTVTVGSSAASLALVGGVTVTTGSSALDLGTDASTGAIGVGTAGNRAISLGHATSTTGISLGSGEYVFGVNESGTGNTHTFTLQDDSAYVATAELIFYIDNTSYTYVKTSTVVYIDASASADAQKIGTDDVQSRGVMTGITVAWSVSSNTLILTVGASSATIKGTIKILTTSGTVPTRVIA